MIPSNPTKGRPEHLNPVKAIENIHKYEWTCAIIFALRKPVNDSWVSPFIFPDSSGIWLETRKSIDLKSTWNIPSGTT